MLNFNLLDGFYLFCVFGVTKISLKKIGNCLEFVLMASFTILLTLIPSVASIFIELAFKEVLVCYYERLFLGEAGSLFEICDFFSKTMYL